MSHLPQPDGTYIGFYKTSASSDILEERKPVFLAATDAGVATYLATKAEAAKSKEVTMRQSRLAIDKISKLAKLTPEESKALFG